MPGDTTGLAEDAVLLAGAKEGATTLGPPGYAGPCPPAGPAHEYVFTLCGVDSEIGLAAGATMAQIIPSILSRPCASTQGSRFPRTKTVRN